MNSGSHHHQTVTDYAKPTKGIQTIHQTVTETTSTYEEESPHFRHGDQLDSMLGNLQANMSRQGVNTVQKGCCNACEKPIVGQVITALGKTWHPEHFTCNHCSQELGTRNFFERDGFPYCETDYHSLFSPRCNYCNGAILDVGFSFADTWTSKLIYYIFFFFRNASLLWIRPGTLSTFSVLNAVNSLVKMVSMNAMVNHIAKPITLRCLLPNVMDAIGPLWRTTSLPWIPNGIQIALFAG